MQMLMESNAHDVNSVLEVSSSCLRMLETHSYWFGQHLGWPSSAHPSGDGWGQNSAHPSGDGWGAQPADCGKYDASASEPFKDFPNELVRVILRWIQVSVCAEHEVQATNLQEAVMQESDYEPDYEPDHTFYKNDFHDNNSDWVMEAVNKGLLSRDNCYPAKQWLHSVMFSWATINHIRQRSRNNDAEDSREERAIILTDVKQCILLNQVNIIGGAVCAVCASEPDVHAGMAFKPIAMSCKLLGAEPASGASKKYSVPAIDYTVSGSGYLIGQSFQALMKAQGHQWWASSASQCLEVGRLPSVDSLKNLNGDVDPSGLLLAEPCIFRNRRTRWGNWKYSPAHPHWDQY